MAPSVRVWGLHAAQYGAEPAALFRKAPPPAREPVCHSLEPCAHPHRRASICTDVRVCIAPCMCVQTQAGGVGGVGGVGGTAPAARAEPHLETVAGRCAADAAADAAVAVQEKQDIERKVEQARERVEGLVALEVKLSDAIDAKRSGLLAADLAAGVEYKDDASGVRIACVPAT